jgi:hypothetical protein
VYRAGKEVGEHACYYPAEQQAKRTGDAVIEYQGIRGQWVRVYPLEPLTLPEVVYDYSAEPYL